jgi:hypothetical protein
VQHGRADAFVDLAELQKYVKKSERAFRKERAQQLTGRVP